VNYATYFENFYVNCNLLFVKDTLCKLWDDIVFTLIDFIIRKFDSFDFRVYLLNCKSTLFVYFRIFYLFIIIMLLVSNYKCIILMA
jgi:hypothetical protein